MTALTECRDTWQQIALLFSNNNIHLQSQLSLTIKQSILTQSQRKPSIYTNAIRLPPSVDILGNERRVHLIPCPCGVGCKRALVLEMKDRVSVSHHFHHRLYIAINTTQREIKFNQTFNKFTVHILSHVHTN